LHWRKLAMDKSIYDVIGIGLGPFNLSLACLTAPLEGVSSLFLDKKAEFNWHPGMMLPEVSLQTPFMSDLVTLADPTSPYSFLNYIKQQGRLYSFYIRENFFLLRQEYNQYCQWATKQLPNIRFNSEVQHVEYSQDEDIYIVQTAEQVYLAKHLVLGTGPVPRHPQCAQAFKLQEGVIHSSNYLANKSQLQQKQSISIIGSGQSAAEIFYDLLQEIDQHNYQLNWLTRSSRFYPLEYTKLTLEMTSPEYVDYFYQLPEQKRQQLNSRQHNLYKGINSELINNIFDLLYSKRLTAKLPVSLHTNSALIDMTYLSHQQGFELSLEQTEQQQGYSLNTQSVIFATGYQSYQPSFLAGISHCIDSDDAGLYQVARNYSIDKQHQRIFVQNTEQHTHGFVTPDLGMACYRNSCIIRAITGHEYYPIERKIAFQEFAAPNYELSDEVEQFRA
jgi:lysine N6-hydroxylase